MRSQVQVQNLILEGVLIKPSSLVRIYSKSESSISKISGRLFIHDRGTGWLNLCYPYSTSSGKFTQNIISNVTIFAPSLTMA